MNINLDELREAARLLREMAADAEKILPVLQYAEKNQGVTVPTATDRFIERGDVCKILKIGTSTVSTLIKQGHLTPLYIADSSTMKFRLSEVERVPTSRECPKTKSDNLGDKRGRREKS
ncbi:MAG: hypothetical protein IKO05_11820 [Selenomonadaceae bacterium]|nr:hypothetical protein [Selenomonadaceae bacterium]